MCFQSVMYELVLLTPLCPQILKECNLIIAHLQANLEYLFKLHDSQCVHYIGQN